MICELQTKIEPELKLGRVDVSELRSNTTKLSTHISICMDSIKCTTPPAALPDKVAQFQTHVSVLMVGCNALSNETGLRISRIAERLALSKQKKDIGFTPAPTREECRKPAEKSVYPSNTDFALSKYSSSKDFEEKPRFSPRASHHRRQLFTNQGLKNGL